MNAIVDFRVVVYMVTEDSLKLFWAFRTINSVSYAVSSEH